MTRPTRRRLAVASLLMIALALTLVSCAYPQLTLRGARLNRVELNGLTVDMYLDVNNPNQFALPLQQVDWTLQLFGLQVGAGTSRLNRTLPAQQTTRVRMPITVKFQQSYTVAQRVARSRSIPWTINGTATFQAPTGPIAMDFGDQGRWNNPMYR